MRHPILHPVPLCAAALMSLNDHVLKGSEMLPGWCTGKISDVLGLFFFPMLLVSLHELWTRRRATSRVMMCAGAVTALVFAWINLWEWPAHMLSPWCAITPDATDLLTLPMIGVATWWMGRVSAPASSRRALMCAAVTAAALSSLATSLPLTHYELARDYPIWRPEQAATAQMGECMEVSWWVAKSGKQGVGIGLRVLNPCAQTQEMTLDTARFEVTGFGSVEASGTREPVRLEAGQATSLYLPFVFDNEQAWNDRNVEATLRIRFNLDGRLIALDAPLHYSQRATYRCIPFKHVSRSRLSPSERCHQLDAEVSSVKEDDHVFMH